jgi:hypothetical protein
MNEEVIALAKSYRDYRTARQQVFGLEENRYHKAHALACSMHHPEEVINYANLNIIDAQVDEVSFA